METSTFETQATGKRHRLLVMLFVTVVITYLDRSNLSIAATAIAHDLQLDPPHMGLVFSAFGWSYALLQIPGGMLVDRARPRLMMALIIGLWSIATILQGFASAFALLLSLRVLLGVLEAPAYPTLNRIVTTWFPDSERARAIAVYTSGQYVGLAFLTPALVLTQQHFGWHGVFILTGLIGVAWALEGRSTDHNCWPVSVSKALNRRSRVPPMKVRPPAVVIAPPRLRDPSPS